MKKTIFKSEKCKAIFWSIFFQTWIETETYLADVEVDKLLRDLVIPNDRLGNFKWPSENTETQQMGHVTDQFESDLGSPK